MYKVVHFVGLFYTILSQFAVQKRNINAPKFKQKKCRFPSSDIHRVLQHVTNFTWCESMFILSF